MAENPAIFDDLASARRALLAAMPRLKLDGDKVKAINVLTFEPMLMRDIVKVGGLEDTCYDFLNDCWARGLVNKPGLSPVTFSLKREFEVPHIEPKPCSTQKDQQQKRQTRRGVTDRQRFRILKRDGFKCLSCGASPAMSGGVELHVDHIVPWSQGGETVDDNLQTKCHKCNLGKGNAFNV